MRSFPLYSCDSIRDVGEGKTRNPESGLTKLIGGRRGGGGWSSSGVRGLVELPMPTGIRQERETENVVSDNLSILL